MFEKIKIALTTEVKLYTFIFAVLGIFGWISNGIYKTSFSVTDLVWIFGVIVVNATGEKFIDSRYNSPQGVMPPDKRKESNLQ